MKKNKTRNSLIIVAIIVGAILLLNNLNILSFVPQHATSYKTYSVSYDGKTLTYSNPKDYTDSGFKNIHGIYESYIGEVLGNPKFYNFYLEINDMDSSKFKIGGTQSQICTFSPIQDGNRIYADELERLGFTWHTAGYSTRNPNPGCWGGNYKVSNLRSNADKLICSVKGGVNQICEGTQIISSHCIPHTYNFDILGKVRVDEDSFYCEIDSSELYNNLPKTIQISDPAYSGKDVNVGIAEIPHLKTEFRIAEEKTFYRLENNKCSSVLIYENKKIEKDYESYSECQNKIVYEEDSGIEGTQTHEETLTTDVSNENTTSEDSRNFLQKFNDWIVNKLKKLFRLD